jgi:hypothetical protein
MDFSQYYVVPIAHRAAVAKLFEAHRIIEEDKFVIVISDDEKRAAKLDVALSFNNDEWAAWGFTVYAKGKVVANGIFGENDETGISIDDNCLEGDLDEAARLLGVDAKKLRKVVESEDADVEKFIKVVGFGRYSITPYELDSAQPKEKKALFDPEHFVMEDGVAKKREPKPKTKPKTKPKKKAKKAKKTRKR